jgi:hypothetical protein
MRALKAGVSYFVLVCAVGDRWDSPPKIRFAPDSPLEGTGFEPSVPLPREATRETDSPLERKGFELLVPPAG